MRKENKMRSEKIGLGRGSAAAGSKSYPPHKKKKKKNQRELGLLLKEVNLYMRKITLEVHSMDHQNYIKTAPKRIQMLHS